jgi:outer membrane protein TolC
VTGRSSLTVLGVLLAVLALAPRALAAETLEQAWQMALAHDPGLASVNQELESARAAERSARGARLPTLTVGGAYTQFADAPALSVDTPGFRFRSPRVFDNDDTASAYAEMKLPLYAGGSIAAGVRAAQATRQAAEAEQLRALADLKLEVAERFVDVLRTRAAVATAAAQVEALRSHVRDVEIMAERGAVNRSDLLASRVALANAEQQRLRAVSAAAQARAAYNRRLGEPLEREPDLEARFAPFNLPAGGPLGELQARALQERSEIASLAARAQSLRAQARAQTGRRLPQLGLTAGYNHVETTILDRQDFSMIGLGVTWQLFDGGQARNRAASLARASRAADLRLEELAAGIRLEVQQAWLGLDEAQARVVATRDAVEQADENLRMSRELYSADLIANTQVLEAVALQLEAAANARNAQLDSDLSRLRLLRAAGSL